MNVCVVTVVPSVIVVGRPSTSLKISRKSMPVSSTVTVRVEVTVLS